MESVPGFPSLCPFSRTAPSLPISLDPAGTQIRIMLEQSDVNIVDVLSGRSAQYRIQRKARPLVPLPGRNLEGAGQGEVVIKHLNRSQRPVFVNV
jgi:hypothetical protein